LRWPNSIFDALARAAQCDAASAGEQARHLETLAAHHRQLEVWAENCAENFANRASLVAAEIARLEGRELDAERLYEQAIRSARDNGFIQNEALANELASRFYAARGFEKIARVYLQDARYGYLHWGADGKVRQLEQFHPYLRDASVHASPTATIGAPVEHLDVGSVLKAAQAVSGEIVLDKLIERLMRIAIEHAGAERGLLILFPGDEPRIAAEATTGRGQVASIAHEVNQPLAAVIANAEACLRWLDRGTPDLDAVRRSVQWVIDDGGRASEVIRRVRALATKADIERAALDINDVVKEVIALVQRELFSHRVSLQMEFAPALPMIMGDRVQLQQLIINLVMNGIEAMQSVTDRPRELVIRSGEDDAHGVRVSVADCGHGISAEDADRLFNPFFTTKSSGMGMGLSICRSIMEVHGGRLWATANVPHGATFQFTLPVNADTAP
jgi:signal transduction histidine kinase